MRRTLLILSLLVLAPLGMAKEPGTRLEFELTDGSRVFGDAVDKTTLTLKTRLGEILIPWTELALIEPTADRQVIACLANGDRLTGTPIGSVETQMLLGRVSIPLAVVRRLLIHPGAAPANEQVRLQPESHTVSGSWTPQPPEYALDGVPGAWSSGDWKGWFEIDLGSRREISKIAVLLQFDPTGTATHEFYISDEPMGTSREKGKLLQRFQGERKDGEVLALDCPAGTQARYVQVHCPESRSWFNLVEFEVWGPK